MIKKLALVAGLAGTMTGCYTYVPARTVVAPAPVVATPVVATPVVAPAVVAPAPVIVPAYRPFWWGPRFHHHHHHGRW